MTKLKVVPEPSERCTMVMRPSGSFTPAFTAAMAGSFQVLILPRKMLARTGPLRRILFGPPSSRLYLGNGNFTFREATAASGIPPDVSGLAAIAT